MSVELLHLIKKKTSILVEKTGTRSQERLEFKMNISRQTFPFDIPLNLEKDKWLLASND